MLGAKKSQLIQVIYPIISTSGTKYAYDLLRLLGYGKSLLDLSARDCIPIPFVQASLLLARQGTENMPRRTLQTLHVNMRSL